MRLERVSNMCERVSIAAIRYREVTYVGARHLDIKTKILEALGELPKAKEYEEGFLTDAQRFVTRKEAAKIAFSAGQTRTELQFLYSEDIY